VRPRNLWGSDSVDRPPTGQWDRERQEMSQLIAGISGALALSLISGAAEFASGRNLDRDLSAVADNRTPINQSLSLSSGSPTEDTSSVNRGSKADRAAGPAGSPALTRTVSLQLNGVSDTTFLVRFPVAASTPAAARSSAKPAIGRSMAACEPVVSLLTEVAKQLQPGSCVT
jgi:hypothetical protein